MTALLLSTFLAASTTMLFVGNSYTFGNGGLWTITDSLFSSVTVDTLITLSHTMGGATLQDHWNDQELRWLLENGDIDMAIFQEQSCMPVINPRLTYQYGDSLALLCAAEGIQPSFLMTWPRKNDPLMLHGLEEGYSRMGYVHGCPVAPCGRAFAMLQGAFFMLDLYAADGSHPSMEGSYLAASVIAVSVLEADITVPGAWRPSGMSEPLGELIRETATIACSLYTQPMERSQ